MGDGNETVRYGGISVSDVASRKLEADVRERKSKKDQAAKKIDAALERADRREWGQKKHGDERRGLS